MPGYPCTGGMVNYLDDLITEENVLVKVWYFMELTYRSVTSSLHYFSTQDCES